LQRRANWKPGQITRMRHLRSAAPGQTPPSLQNAAVAKRPACKILSRGEIKRALPAVTPQTGRVYLSHRTGCGYDEISRARGGMPTKMIERYVAQLVLALETQGDRMNAEGSESGTAVIARARAEAAAWIARILRSARSTRVESKFRRWLAAKPAHAAAWKLALDVWNSSAGPHLKLTGPLLGAGACTAHLVRDKGRKAASVSPHRTAGGY
jgi:hypothetical protein